MRRINGVYFFRFPLPTWGHLFAVSCGAKGAQGFSGLRVYADVTDVELSYTYESAYQPHTVTHHRPPKDLPVFFVFFLYFLLRFSCFPPRRPPLLFLSSLSFPPTHHHHDSFCLASFFAMV